VTLGIVRASVLYADKGPKIPDFGKTSDCVKNNGSFCWAWFRHNWSSQFEPRLWEHIELTVVSVGVGFVIAFVLALLAYRARWLAGPVTFVTSVLYTIPSLAAFLILVPITGLGRMTLYIPLTSYTLLILFTNTLAGLTGVPDEIKDAARGNGLTPMQSLWQVELPLAIPTIMAGVRVAVVTIVSLATIAAAVEPVGLGERIFDALNKGNFHTQFIAAGVLCVLLALVADGLLVLLQRVVTPWTRARRTR